MESSSETSVETENKETEEKTEIEKETDKWIEILLEENSTEVEVIVEIPKNSRIKYEYDKEAQRMVCDRILTTPFSYFFNYGYIPNTLSEDGDPIDAVILMEDAIYPGCSIRCRILGYLETKDEKGNDPKLILCPTSKIDPGYDHWRDILDISIAILNKLKYFFTHYKDLEEGKFVEVGHFMGKEDAKQMIIESRMLYYSNLMDESQLILENKSKTN
jgi:inorganic pyrophosphatase